LHFFGLLLFLFVTTNFVVVDTFVVVLPRLVRHGTVRISLAREPCCYLHLRLDICWAA
jgi:hypothetical protein